MSKTKQLEKIFTNTKSNRNSSGGSSSSIISGHQKRASNASSESSTSSSTTTTTTTFLVPQIATSNENDNNNNNNKNGAKDVNRNSNEQNNKRSSAAAIIITSDQQHINHQLLMRTPSKRNLGKKASVVAAAAARATSGITSGSSSAASSLSSSKQELNLSTTTTATTATNTTTTTTTTTSSATTITVDMNNNEIGGVAAAVGGGVGGSGELVARNAALLHRSTDDSSCASSTVEAPSLSFPSPQSDSFLSLASNNNSPNNTNDSRGAVHHPAKSNSIAVVSLSPISPSASQQQKASNKSNDRFHELFPSVPLDEHVIDTYSCAYAKSLNLYQGMMYLTSNYICFYSKFLNHILILKFSHINSITKSMHAVIFPTAIRIETRNAAYSFTSFLSRSNTLDHLAELWKQYRQRQANEATMCKKSKKLVQASQRHEAEQKSHISRELTSFSGVINLSTVSSSGGDTNESASSKQHRAGSSKPGDEARNANSSIDTANTSLNNDNDNEDDEDDIDDEEEDECDDDDDDEMPEEIALYDSSPSSPDNKLFQLKTSHSSPLFNGKSMMTSDRIGDQFRLYKPGSVTGAGYYDYCYGQQLASDNLFYDFDFSDLSKNMVTVSLRHRQTLLQKVKILMSILIPGFFNISRIDALLPICFVMCVLLLLNAFVLLNKVNQVDEIFTKLLTNNDF